MNRRVAVVTDSTADLDHDLAAQRDITIVPLTVRLDGHSYLDGEEISAAQFYEKLTASSGFPTTSQPSAGQFETVYRRLLEDHDDVVSIHISAKLSGTLASAHQAAAAVDRERVHVVDSESVSMGLALMALVAAELAKRGAGDGEIVDELAPVRTASRLFFVVSTLEFLRRGGRIGRASALLGSVLQIKPILSIQDAQVTPYERVRTQDRALNRIVELARDVDRGAGLCLSIGHAAAEEAARGLAERLEDVAETLVVQPLGPVVGAHAGPGTVGVACYPAELFPLGIKPETIVGAAR